MLRQPWNRIPLRCALAALLVLIVAGPAAAEKRVALVIGNSAYQNITRLDNPHNDATLMADTLLGLGFTLIGGRARLDLDKAALDSDVQSFGRLSPRSLFHEGITDRITSGTPRREIAISHPRAGHTYRKQLMRIGAPVLPCPVSLVLRRCPLFAARAG